MELPDPKEEYGNAEAMKGEAAMTAATKLEKRMIERECEVGFKKECFVGGDDNRWNLCEGRKTLYIPRRETASTEST